MEAIWLSIMSIFLLGKSAFSGDNDGSSSARTEAAYDPDGDEDEDGLKNWEEEIIGTDVNLADSDGDGVDDYYEFVNLVTDPLNADSDGDGFSDGAEIEARTPAHDGRYYPGNRHVSNEKDDRDHDGLTDAQERELGTVTSEFDTDGDGVSDGEEVHVWESDPLQSDLSGDYTDSDGDGLSDLAEADLGTDPEYADSDGDRLSDLVELGFGSDPNLEDTDDDGVPDAVELEYFGDPNNTDTDGDGTNDYDEIYDEFGELPSPHYDDLSTYEFISGAGWSSLDSDGDGEYFDTDVRDNDPNDYSADLEVLSIYDEDVHDAYLDRMERIREELAALEEDDDDEDEGEDSVFDLIYYL